VSEGIAEQQRAIDEGQSSYQKEYDDYVKMYGHPPPPGWKPDHEVPHDFDRPAWMVASGLKDTKSDGPSAPIGRKVRKEYPRALVASVLISLPLILLLVSLFTGGWYSVENDVKAERGDVLAVVTDEQGNTTYREMEFASVENHWEFHYGLHGMSMEEEMDIYLRDPISGTEIENSTSLSKDYGSGDEGSTATITFVGGLIGVAAMIAVIPLGYMSSKSRISGIFPLAMALGAGLLLIIAMIFFSVGFPGRVEGSDIFRSDVIKSSVNLGPEFDSLILETFDGALEGGSFGWSYYLAWVSILLLIGTGCVFIGVKKDVRWVTSEVEEKGVSLDSFGREPEPQQPEEEVRYRYRV